MSFSDSIWEELTNLEVRIDELENPAIDDQTIHFFHLQLQFMSIDTFDLVNIFMDMQQYFPRTKPVKRSVNRCYKYLSDYGGELNQDEHNCIATTLAINMAGLA